METLDVATFSVTRSLNVIFIDFMYGFVSLTTDQVNDLLRGLKIQSVNASLQLKGKHLFVASINGEYGARRFTRNGLKRLRRQLREAGALAGCSTTEAP